MPQMTPGADAAAGDVIAGYEIRRRLGRGGMGDVYLAFDPRLDSPRYSAEIITESRERYRFPAPSKT